MKTTREKVFRIFFYLLIIVLSGVAGVLTRRYPDIFPDFIAKYAGDTLWAFALFFLVSIFFFRKSIRFRLILTLLLSLADELSQLYHAPWIDGLRASLPGGLILGNSFVWSDLLCYLAGGILAACIVFFISAQKKYYEKI